MNILEQLSTAFDDLFEMEDSELEAAMPVISQELTNAFMGPAAETQINDYFRQCDLAGYTLEQYNQDIETAKTVFYQCMTAIKEKYSDSLVKGQLVDMVYSLVESFYAVLAIRVASRDKITIGIELTHPNAKLPTYAHEGDQGADIYAVEDTTIPPHTFGTMIPTGIKMLIPFGWAVSIRPRSGLSRTTPLRISNSPATIDQQYRGEVKILFDNFSDKPIAIKAGDRIAQFVLEKNYHSDYTQVDTVAPDTERGEGGFGSSGQ